MHAIHLFNMQDDNDDNLSPIAAVAADGENLVVTYADGSVMSEPFETSEGRLDVVLLRNDEVYVDRAPLFAIANPFTLEQIVERLSLWIDSYSPLAGNGMPPVSAAIGENSLMLTGVDGEVEEIPLIFNDRELRVIWVKDQLVGFDHGGTRGEVFDAAMLPRINERLRVLGARMRKDWHIVKDECVRLGSTPRTDIKVGWHVKIGFQPDEPMPDDYNAEWMWVLVTGVSKDGSKLTGRLQNTPTMVGIEQGDRVRFSNRDIYGVEEG